MATLSYGPMTALEFDDRTLAHLQLVIGAKLRRRESFFFSWADESSDGGGRTTVWIEPSVPLAFRYATATMPQINRLWIDALTASASSPQGLMLTPEPVGENLEAAIRR